MVGLPVFPPSMAVSPKPRTAGIMLRIGIVAGEASGDLLAADLIESIKKQVPDVVVEGVGGPRMQAAGCNILYSSDLLAVMGLVEVAGKYFQLVKIRNSLIEHFRKYSPDVFIGVDAPDFNLGLEQALHNHGIKTVHYVSPSVWAWRSYRVKKIKKAVDLMLVLFPFEQEIYRQHRIAVEFVGHPLADQIATDSDKQRARKNLGLPAGRKIVAIMPGSRQTEIDRMLPLLLETASWCSGQRNDLLFVTSVLSEKTVRHIEKMSSRFSVELQIYHDRSHEVLAAADAALLTSGTVTLEAMLFNLPMLVAYRINWLSYLIIRALVKVEYAALPNLLAGKRVVAEYLQAECEPEVMGQELLSLLDNDATADRQKQEFNSIHWTLRLNAGDRAAASVLSLLK